MNPMTHQMHHSDAVVAYQKQHEVVTSAHLLSSFLSTGLTPFFGLDSALYRYLMDARDQTTGWALPLLYVVCRDLRKIAEQVGFCSARRQSGRSAKIRFPLCSQGGPAALGQQPKGGQA